MARLPLVALVCLVANLATSQTPPPPHTARQALIEMFFGTGPNHLEKHLPDITRNAFKKMPSANGMNSLDEFSMIASQLKAGGKFETFETGPTLLSTEDPNNGKVELTVERDDLGGDEDQIELALHITKNFKEESLPIIPRFTFLMAQQADVWRLNEIDITVKVPLSDPTFLKSIEYHQRSQNEMMTIYTVQSIVGAEKSYSAAQGAYACSLSALGSSAGTEHRTYLFDRQLISGKKNGYIFVISNCDAAHYKVVAEPEVPNSGQRAFCSDEGGTVRASADGKATTCLSSGEVVRDGGGPTGITLVVPSTDVTGANATPSAKPATANSPAKQSRKATDRVRVSAGVMHGLQVRNVYPAYPAEAKAAGAQGSVVLHAIIGTDGNIQSLNVLSSASPLLDQAALDAVRQWTYRPYLLNGTPVEVDTQITVNFTLASR